MSRAYWEQWDKEDIDAMHGKDVEMHGNVLEGKDRDKTSWLEDVDPPRGCRCGDCMECMGMSWYDFM